jgi:hypothetical protein
VLGKHLGLVSEHLHVEEVRLVGPVAGLVLLAAVAGDAELEDRRPRWKVAELRVARQAPHEGHTVDVASHFSLLT